MREFLIECDWLLIQIRFTLILCLSVAWRSCPVLGHYLHAFRSGCSHCRGRYAGYAGFAVTLLFWRHFETNWTMWTMFGHDMLLLCLLVWILIALEMRGRKPSYVRTAYQYHIWRENMDTVVGRLLFLIALIALREGVGRSTIAIATGIFTIQKIPCEPRETWITNQPPRPTDTTPPLNPA